MSITFAELHTMLAARPVRGTAPNKAPDFLNDTERPLWQHLAEWRGGKAVTHPRQVFYAASYRTQTAEVTKKYVAQMAQGEHAATRLGALGNCDVRVYEMDLNMPCAAALNESTAAHAISYGLLAVEEGIDLLLLGTLSAGAEKIMTELNEKLQQAKAADVLQLFAAMGGVDLCAALGAALSARMALVPVIADNQLTAILHRAISLLCDGNENESPVVAALPDTERFDAPLQPLATWYHVQGLMALVPARPVLTTLSHAA